MAYDPNGPPVVLGGGGTPPPGTAPTQSGGGNPIADFGRWLGTGLNNFLGIRATPESAGAPIDPAAMGPALTYGFMDDAAAAQLAQQQAREQQMALNEAILARARGEGPSVAEMQLRQATDRLQGQQAGMVASQRGMNPALQRRLIMSQAATGQQQMNAQGALLRAQEQQAAQALASQSLGQMRGQDVQGYGQAAQSGLQQSSTLSEIERANQIASLEAEKLRAEQERFNAKQRMGLLEKGGELIAAAPKVAAGLGMAGGGMVPGYAQGGDNPRNDTVPAWLSPQEVVLPRSVTLAPDAPAKAAEFMSMMQARPQAKTMSPAMRLMRGGK